VSSVTCTILARLSPLSWATAIGLVIAREIDPRLQVLGMVVVLTGAGLAGTVCGAIRSTDTYEKRLLMEALRASQRDAGRPAAGHLRRVR
jgi:hypothetical protein